MSNIFGLIILYHGMTVSRLYYVNKQQFRYDNYNQAFACPMDWSSSHQFKSTPVTSSSHFNTCTSKLLSDFTNDPFINFVSFYPLVNI